MKPRFPHSALVATFLLLVPLWLLGSPSPRIAMVTSGPGSEALGGRLAQQLAARLAGAGYSVVQPSEVVGAAAREGIDPAVAEASSLAALAGSLGADYFLVADLAAIDSGEVAYSGYGLEQRGKSFRLVVSSRMVRAADATAVEGTVVEAVRMYREDANLSRSTAGVENSLADEAAARTAEFWQARIGEGIEGLVEVPAPALVALVLIVSAGDVRVPRVVETHGGTLVVAPGEDTPRVLGVTVEVDGIAAGTAPGKVQATPGIHRVRLTREGFRPWERMVNFREGLSLSVAMEFDEAGLERWREEAVFLASLRDQRALTDAEAERIRGDAQRLRQSGILYEIKVDTDEAPTIRNDNRTLQGNIEN